jgi:hypothetical protein
MAVSLFDTMRPMALGCGLGAAWGTASAQGVGSFGLCALCFGGLTAGILAIWISQRVVRRLNPWVAEQQGNPSRKLRLAWLYVAVFVAIGVFTYGGGACGRMLAAI